MAAYGEALWPRCKPLCICFSKTRSGFHSLCPLGMLLIILRIRSSSSRALWARTSMYLQAPPSLIKLCFLRCFGCSFISGFQRVRKLSFLLRQLYFARSKSWLSGAPSSSSSSWSIAKRRSSKGWSTKATSQSWFRASTIVS